MKEHDQNPNILNDTINYEFAKRKVRNRLEVATVHLELRYERPEITVGITEFWKENIA